MKHLVLFILGLCLVEKPTQAQGLVPNGGDPISIEFLEIARSLPGIIVVKGEEQFPGLTVPTMLATVNDLQWKIHLGKDLSINGVRKAALTYTEQKITVIDEDMWKYVSLLPEAKKRKRAFVFHEVLVLMKLEYTNDYHLSSRLYGPEILKEPYENEILKDPSSGKKKIQTIGRLLAPGNSTQGIFAFIYVDQTVKYTFCENRYEPDTCRPLGSPDLYYSVQQINALSSKNNISSKNWRRFGKVSVAVITIGGGTIISFMMGMPLLAYPTAYVLSAPLLLGSMLIAESKKAVVHATDDQMMSGKTITRPQSSDLVFIAQKLDEALLKLSPSGISTGLKTLK